MQATPETSAAPAVDIADAKQRLQTLHVQHASGAIDQQAFDAEKARLEQQILDWALHEPAASVDKSSLSLFAMLALAVLIVAAVGYYLTSRSLVRPADGMPASAIGSNSVPAGAADGGNAGAAQPHATSGDQIGNMVDKLAARLKDNPDDVAGWAMLARSYSVLGRTTDAVDAYAKAEKLAPNEAGLLVDYADAMAVKNNRTLAGEPMKLIARALAIDPRNVKGLAMAGTDAFDRKDYGKAVKQWESMVVIGGDDNMFVVQIQPRLAEARQLAGLPPKVQAASAPGAKPSQPGGSAAAAGGVSGVVTLSAKLVKDASPEDTLFIFARPASGSRMPLAILRKKVKDLPIQFVLDDSQAMSPAAKLSQAGTIVVGARISKSGQAIPAKGDLAGLSKPVTVGASGLAIEINEVVAQ